MTTATATTVIRLATLDDVPACAQLIRKLRQGTFWRDVVPDEDPNIVGLLLAHRLLTSTSSCLFVADQDGEIIGLCGGELTRNFLSPATVLFYEWAWWVEEPYRSGTVGGRLWVAARQWGEARGARVIFKSSIRSNERRGRQIGEEVYVIEEALWVVA